MIHVQSRVRKRKKFNVNGQIDLLWVLCKRHTHTQMRVIVRAISGQNFALFRLNDSRKKKRNVKTTDFAMMQFLKGRIIAWKCVCNKHIDRNAIFYFLPVSVLIKTETKGDQLSRRVQWDTMVNGRISSRLSIRIVIYVCMRLRMCTPMGNMRIVNSRWFTIA